MASPYKIPKKKQTGDSDSTQVHLQSPLSRLQSPATPFKGFGDQSSRRGTNRMHAGTTQGSSPNSQRTPCRPLFRVVVKTLLGLNSPSSGEALAANHRSPGGLRRQSQGERREDSSSASTAMGWRPKRASDRLLQPEAISKPMSPPQKKKVEENSGLSSESESLSVVAVDTLAELRMKRGTVEGKSASHSGTHHTPQDNRTTPHRSSLSSVCSPRTTPDRRRSLDRSLWTTAGANLKEDVRERQRQKWREFKERTSVTQPRPRRRKQNPVEPIVLCSEDDGEGEDEDDGPKRTSQTDESCLGGTEKKQGPQTVDHVCPPRAEGRLDKSSLPGTLVAQPSFLQLKFSSLHVGLTHATAHGKMLITENSITIPLRVSAEEGEVTVVASQVRGYGVWDGGVARGGTLLAGWEGPAPSLLFLWITDAQANLLQRELSAMHATAVTSGPSCSFLLLVLKEQLQELEAALLASILDMEEYKKGRSSSSPSCSSSSGLASPLDWTDGLLLLHTCPPPLDQHLLRLLGHSADTSGQVRSSQRNKTSSLSSSRLQQLPTRLIQYPAAPCKGRISVTKEDLDCLDAGQFLNDVIIDFYLKYLLLEGVGGAVAERSHVFSSFFYKQLSRRRAAGEDNGPSVPDRHMRHQRVKTWTRHVDIFTKDFLFVPVNQEAHWFLVVVCFPGLDKVQYQDFERRQGGSERGGKASVGLRSQQPPECTQQGCQKNSVLKRPCILVMNSLKLLNHENVCRLVRDYLQVEWEVRRGTPRLFTADNMRSSNCRVPQQDNSSDCGLYLLQYVESFLQNPVVHFDLPLRLDNWFPRQRARQKREEIRSLILKMHQRQQPAGGN